MEASGVLQRRTRQMCFLCTSQVTRTLPSQCVCVQECAKKLNSGSTRLSQLTGARWCLNVHWSKKRTLACHPKMIWMTTRLKKLQVCRHGRLSSLANIGCAFSRSRWAGMLTRPRTTTFLTACWLRRRHSCSCCCTAQARQSKLPKFPEVHRT